MNEKKLTALVGVLAFGIAGMALVPVGMDAGAHTPLAQSNEGTNNCVISGPEYIHYCKPDGTPDYAELIGIIPSTYGDDQSVLIIPEKDGAHPVTTIGESAFEYAGYLERVLIPDTVTTIGVGAFHGCYGISSLTIPDSVTELAAGVFTECQYLNTIILPDTMTAIGNGAFSVCRKLDRVTLPAELKTIGSNAFSYCDALTSVVIYEGLESIGEGAFHDLPAFTDVYFTGTQEEWAQVAIADNNNALDSAAIHFGYQPVSGGDLNLDRDVSAEDAAILLQGAAQSGSGGKDYFNGKQRTQADLNADGAYDSADAAVILRSAAANGAQQS